MEKYYAGIGARATPKSICARMSRLAVFLGRYGYVLRSGGAEGADRAFGLYAPNKEVFIADACTQAAMKLSEQFHPNWDACSEFAKKLHGRNAMILLGENLDTPVNFVVCWTQGGEVVGGTGQALRIAGYYKIPVFNLAADGADKSLWDYIRKHEKEGYPPISLKDSTSFKKRASSVQKPSLFMDGIEADRLPLPYQRDYALVDLVGDKSEGVPREDWDGVWD